MSGLSAVIPSKTAGNVWECVRAVRMNDPSVRVIVVDDGINWNELPKGETSTWTIIPGEKPFVFSRNVNLGIRAAGEDDLVILNDDGLLQTPGGFTLMQRMAQAKPEFGVISAACNNVGNRNQWPRPQSSVVLREEPRTLCFVCVLIMRDTLYKVGLMDERFIGYGMEDDCMSLRVRRSGLKLGIFEGCYVDHASLVSTFRGLSNNAGRGGDFRPNMRIFIEKYGVDNWGRTRETSEFSALFPPEAK